MQEELAEAEEPQQSQSQDTQDIEQLLSTFGDQQTGFISDQEFALDHEGIQFDDRDVRMQSSPSMEELTQNMAAMRAELNAANGLNATLQADMQRLADKLATMENSQIETAGSNRPGILKPDKFGHGDNESWPNFRRRFEHCALFNGWNTQQQKLALVSAMADKAADVVQDLQVKDFFNIGNMLDAYEARFMPAAQSDIVRIQFDKCRQSSRESVLEYHSRLRALYRRAYPESTDDTQLIRRFAFGLANPWVQQMVLRKQAKTYDDALEAALNEAAVMDVADALKTGASSMTNQLPNSANASGHDGHPEPMEIGAMGGNLGSNECMFCGKQGHWKSQCQLWAKARRLLAGKRFNGRTGPTGGGSSQRGNARGLVGRGRGRAGGRGRGRTFQAPPNRDPDRQRSMFRQVVAAMQNGEFDDDEEEENSCVAALDQGLENDEGGIDADELDELVASLTDAEVDALFESGFA